MRKAMAIAVILFFVGQGIAGAATINRFQGGATEAVAQLDAPAFTTVVNFSVPAQCHILKASLNVSAAAPAGGGGYPENVEVLLEETPLWSFSGPDFGPLGRQDGFRSGKDRADFAFNRSGGTGNVTLRLPKKAVVTNATVDITCEGPRKLTAIANLSGDYSNDYFGEVVAGAGDVNGDGFDDILAGVSGDDKARIYFGGPKVNATPDIILSGASMEGFGDGLAGAGDVNGDGYDDVLVSAPSNSSNGTGAGVVYLYLGGKGMDSEPDLIFQYGGTWDQFGSSLASAGDFNGDGYDDVVISATTTSNIGKVYVFYGGSNMDANYDWYQNSSGVGGSEFGWSVSCAGDVNRDGYDDLIVGAIFYARNPAGKTYIFHGGPAPDRIPDVVLNGTTYGDSFGCSVTCAGDVNRDGYDDVLVGASHQPLQNPPGRAFLYFGGSPMDTTPDLQFFGENAEDRFGYVVAGLGDINMDGYDDYGIGAPRNTANGVNSGRAYVYYGSPNPTNSTNFTITGRAWDWLAQSISAAGDVNGNGYPSFVVGAEFQTGNGYVLIFDTVPGILDPRISTGPATVWNGTGYFNGTWRSADFSSALNDQLKSAMPSGNDSFGNRYVDVRLNVTGRDDGAIALSNLGITYDLNATTADFAAALSAYQAAHLEDADADGNITVPVTVRSSTPGNVRLGALNIAIDEAPRLLQPIPDVEMDEDALASELLNMRDYFSDDFESFDQLKLSLVSVSNASIVKVELMGGQYLSADASEGDQNDNWTGAVQLVVRASDRWGSHVDSNPFRVVVRNVPDPPAFTSLPPLSGTAGVEYIYNATAVDGDGDALTFGLARYPPNMTVDAASGRLSWTPVAGGRYAVSLTASDGQLITTQDFFVTVPNRPPRLADTSVPVAYLGERYTFTIPYIDDDGDLLQFAIVADPTREMTVDRSSGFLVWTPKSLGTFGVTVSASDGKDERTWDFNITVVQRNRPPRFQTTPVTAAIAGLPYFYNSSATDKDNDVLNYSLAGGPQGLAVDPARGNVTWTPAAAGNFTVKLRVEDGRGGEDFQNYTILVAERVRPKVVIVSPSDDQTVSGKLSVTGRTVKGTLDIVKVQVRTDSGDWADATPKGGWATWSYSLDTDKLGAGRHAISVRAYDGMDYGEEVNRTVNVHKGGSGGITPGFGGVLVVLAVIAAISMARRSRRG